MLLRLEVSGTDGAVVVSKAVAKAFVSSESNNPLHTLRRSQVAAQGGEGWVGDGVCASRMGASLLSASAGVDEAYGASVIEWICKHASELGEPAELATAIDFCLQVHASSHLQLLPFSSLPLLTVNCSPLAPYTLYILPFTSDLTLHALLTAYPLPSSTHRPDIAVSQMRRQDSEYSLAGRTPKTLKKVNPPHPKSR